MENGRYKPHLDQSNFLAACVQSFDCLLGGFRSRPHHHDHSLRVRGAHIVKQPVLPAHDLGKLVHHGLHLGGANVVVRVRGLTDLKEYVRILRCPAQHRMIRRKCPLPMFEHAVHVNQSPQIVFGQHLNLVYFVRGPEAVEEMKKGNPGFERGRMRDQRKIHSLLHRVRTQHGPAGGTTKHHVTVIAKDGKRVGRQRAGRNVKGCRGQFARNLIHVRNHQQQPLRCRKGGRQRPRLQGSMHRARRAAFTLHFRHVRNRAPDIGNVLRSPLIRPLAHRRRRSDGIDGNDLVQAICDVGYGLIRVHGLEFALHSDPFTSSCRACFQRNPPRCGEPRPAFPYRMRGREQRRPVHASHRGVTPITWGGVGVGSLSPRYVERSPFQSTFQAGFSGVWEGSRLISEPNRSNTRAGLGWTRQSAIPHGPSRQPDSSLRRGLRTLQPPGPIYPSPRSQGGLPFFFTAECSRRRNSQAPRRLRGRPGYLLRGC